MSELQASDLNASTVLVEPGQMAIFEKRLESLNKKAAKFGLSPIKILSSQDALYERKRENVGRDSDKLLTYLVPVSRVQDVEHPVLIKRLQIEYPEIRLGHWRVVGKIEAVEGGNLVFAVSRGASDVAALSARADCPIECEHCNTNRRRKDGYLLRDDESGDYKQVGSNCLEDFTGIDPAAALFMAQMWNVIRLVEDEFSEFGRSGRVNAVRTDQYLADVSFLAANFGFVSASKARETDLCATYSDALSLPDLLMKNAELREKYRAQHERHVAMANAVRAWIEIKEEESTFDRNVKLLLGQDAISLKSNHLAFAAATVPLYQRAHAAKAESRKRSEHIGHPGQKVTSSLVVERVVPIDTIYGASDLVLFRDNDGNRIKWKTSACPFEIKDGVGRSLEATFKVKEHGEYNGSAQTAITHLKVLRWIDAVGIGTNADGATLIISESDSPAVRSAKARFLSEHGAAGVEVSELPKARYRP